MIMYMVLDTVSPSKSNQLVKRRIKRFCGIVFIVLFVGWALFAGTAVAWLAEQTLTVLDYIRLYIYVTLYALIPTLLLYIAIHIYHRYIGGFNTSMQKHKNDERMLE